MPNEPIKNIKDNAGIMICEENFELLVNEYRRAMLVLGSRTMNHFVTESSDEWSVILQAFYEAVQGYEPRQGTFWGFASLIIRSRLTDYLRNIYRQNSLLSGEEPSEELAAPEEWPGKYTISDELEALQDELKGYQISFFGLTETAPKAKKTRKKCAEAIAVLVQTAHLKDKFEKTKKLPASELSAMSGVSKKILERHRDYIIAAAVILTGEYPLLAEYLHAVREEIRK